MKCKHRIGWDRTSLSNQRNQSTQATTPTSVMHVKDDESLESSTTSSCSLQCLQPSRSIYDVACLSF